MSVEALKCIAEALKEGIDLTPPPLDEELVKAAKQHLGVDL